jgi:hypothetical protein
MRRALLAVLLLLVAGLAFDEKTVAATLAGLGSTFIRGENLTRREINAKLAELDAKIDPGDTVFLCGTWWRLVQRTIFCRATFRSHKFAPHLLEPGQEDLELHLQHYGGQIGCGELRRRQAT